MREMIKRIVAMTVALSLSLAMIPATAFSGMDTGLCKHHPAHTTECLYQEGTASSSCEHVHDDDCYAILEEDTEDHTPSVPPASIDDEAPNETIELPIDGIESSESSGEIEEDETIDEDIPSTEESSDLNTEIIKILVCDHADGCPQDESLGCGWSSGMETTPCIFECPICDGDYSNSVVSVVLPEEADMELDENGYIDLMAGVDYQVEEGSNEEEIEDILPEETYILAIFTMIDKKENEVIDPPEDGLLSSESGKEYLVVYTASSEDGIVAAVEREVRVTEPEIVLIPTATPAPQETPSTNLSGEEDDIPSPETTSRPDFLEQENFGPKKKPALFSVRDQAYAMLYSDGTMVFQKGNDVDSAHGSLVASYTGFETGDYYTDTLPWYNERELVKSIYFADEIAPYSLGYWFCDMVNLEEVDCRLLDTSNVYYTGWMFANCKSLKELDLSNFDTSKVIDMFCMFYNCESLTILDVSSFNTSIVFNLSWMFCSCDMLTAIDVTGFDTSAATDMKYMFGYCFSLKEVDVSEFDTSKVESMQYMFYADYELASLDLSSFDTSEVADMENMLSRMRKLETLTLGPNFSFVGKETGSGPNLDNPLKKYFPDTNGLWVNQNGEEFDASELPDGAGIYTAYAYVPPVGIIYTDGTMSFQKKNEPTDPGKQVLATYQWEDDYAGTPPWADQASTITKISFGTKISPKSTKNWFKGCVNLVKVNLSNLDTSNTTDMSSMFEGCSALVSLDLSTIDTSSVTAMESMFDGCNSLRSVILGEKFSFSGKGTTRLTNLPTPSKKYIPTADGYWYDNRQVRYAPNTVPDKCNAVFSASSPSAEAYAILYEDGTMIFQRGAKPVEGHGNVIQTYTGFENSIYNREIAPWYSSRDEIRIVTFIDPVKPVETKFWFDNCSNLTSVDVTNLDTSEVTDMGWMFYGCQNLITIKGIGSLDIHNVTYMQAMFGNCFSLTALDGIGNWDTCNVVDIHSIFSHCSSLATLDVSGWDTSNMKGMGNMFWGCSSLTTLDVSGWDTSKVTYMHGMFDSCSSLTTLDVSGWNTSKVTDMRCMFSDCSSLTALDVSGWDTSKVTYMYNMFDSCSSLTTLNGISGWNTSNVTDTSHMFNDCSSLKSLSLTGWDTRNVTNMSGMFAGMESIEHLDLSSFDTSNVTSMYFMFSAYTGNSETGKNTALKSLDLSNFDTSNVTDMASMFQRLDGLEVLNLANFNTDKVTNMKYMFNCAGLKELNIENFSTQSCTNIENMLNYAHSLEKITVGPKFSFAPSTSATKTTLNSYSAAASVYGYWYNTSGQRIPKDEIPNYRKDTYTVYGKPYATLYEDGTLIFDVGATASSSHGEAIMSWSGFDTNTASEKPQWYPYRALVSKVIFQGAIHPKNTAYWFQGMHNLSAITSLHQLDTKSVTNMEYMFDMQDGNSQEKTDNTALKSLDLRYFVTDKVTDMTGMFQNLSGLTTLSIGNFNTSNVTSMDSMFAGLSSMTSLNLKHFNTQNVTSMKAMFSGMSQLSSLDMGNFDTSNCTDMSKMFMECSHLKSVNIENFNTEKVSHFDRVFAGCESLSAIDLRNWNTGNAVSMADMFNGCIGLSTVTLGEDFTFDGAGSTRLCNLVSGTKMWYNTRREPFSGTSIPNNTFDVYQDTPDNIAYAALHADGTLAFYRSQKPLSKYGETLHTYSGFEIDIYSSQVNTPWYPDRGSIKQVIIVESVRPRSTAYWFSGMMNLTHFDGTNLDTTQAESMKGMFDGSDNIMSVTLGKKFTFNGNGSTRMTSLPSPSPLQVDATDGNWYNSANKPFAPEEIPNNTADTYYPFSLTQNNARYSLDGGVTWQYGSFEKVWNKAVAASVRAGLSDICEHHTEHTDECFFREAVAGQPERPAIDCGYICQICSPIVELNNSIDQQDHIFGEGVGFSKTGSILVPKGASIILRGNNKSIDRGYSLLATPLQDGSVITVDGRLVLDMGIGQIKGGNASNGGGVSISPSGTCILNSGNLRRNRAYWGSAIYNEGTFIQNGGGISNNGYPNKSGSGTICNCGTMILNGGTITENYGQYGSAIYTKHGSLSVFNQTTMQKNTASYGGQDIWVDTGSIIDIGTGKILIEEVALAKNTILNLNAPLHKQSSIGFNTWDTPTFSNWIHIATAPDSITAEMDSDMLYPINTDYKMLVIDNSIYLRSNVQTIKFYVDGKVYRTETIHYGDTLTDWEFVNTLDKYTFKGWTTNKSGQGDLWNFSTPIVGDVSLYAILEEIPADIMVQQYAWIKTLSPISAGAKNELLLIDTSGGKLPKNGTGADGTPTGNAPIKMYLTNDGKVSMTKTLTKIYESTYYSKDDIVDIMDTLDLADETSYSISEIWILRAGSNKSSDSTNRADWEVHPYTKGLILSTNDAESDIPGVVMINSHDVVRFVYELKGEKKSFNVDFYDYDIGDGFVYGPYSSSPSSPISEDKKKNTSETSKTKKIWYLNTSRKGINSPENYRNKSASTLQKDASNRLGFGNANTGSGLQGEKISGQMSFINIANANNYKKCVFGLTESLNSDGSIKWASGVDAPNLFGNGEAIGKTPYNNGEYSLSFIREGDTYTLHAVDNTTTTNLEYFGNPGTHYTIWTNHFWPMDSAPSAGTDGHDMMFGDREYYSFSRYYGTSYGNWNPKGNLPPSDDGLRHNSYFGMHYAIEFTLKENYVGPLEYYFFGDDDMWVFLDDQLVCDIGGVHAAVGEYVNLWDYLPQGTVGSHTLSVYYTERGASGSTCWMSFTLPMAKPKEESGSLTIQKEVVNGRATQYFDFQVNLTDASGEPIAGKYFYSGSKNGSLRAGGTIQLKHGESVTITGLPVGTRYEVIEDSSTLYETSSTGTSGVIIADVNATASFVNTFGSYTFEFLKHDNYGDPVYGAEFSLYSLEDIGLTKPIATAVSSEENNATVVFTDLFERKYLLKETSVPDGYVAQDTVYTVDVWDGGFRIFSDDGVLKDNIIINVKVNDMPTVELPKTGGPGSLSIRFIGIGLNMWAVSAWTMTKRKKKADREEE